MNIDIIVPSFGESVSEAVVVKIIKPSGSIVIKDEEIVELETDKINSSVLAPESGKLQLNIKLEDRVTIGQKIGEVDSTQKAEIVPKVEIKKETVKVEPIVQTAKSPIVVTVDEYLQSLGKEKKEIVKTRAEPKEIKDEIRETTTQRKKMSSLRKTIAKKLVEVKNQTAMLTTFNEADMTKIMEIRQKEQDEFVKKYGVKLGFMSFFVKACASA